MATEPYEAFDKHDPRRFDELSDSLVRDIERAVWWGRIVTLWLVVLTALVAYLIWR